MPEKKFNDRITLLTQKWRNNQLTEAEKTELETWYAGFDDSLLEQDSPDSVDDLKRRLYSSILEKEAIPLSQPFANQPVRRLWPRYAAAASVVAILASTTWLITHQRQNPTVSPIVHDIAPGGNKAILTLGNGSQIVLSDAKQGQLARQQDITIEKTADGIIHYATGPADGNNAAPTNNIATTVTYNTISTPRGGQYAVTLSDGTEVILNAASSLRYPAAFTEKDRSVQLTGEAWFNVATDKEHPFIVTSGNQDVKVLGTQFNLNAYNDEPGIRTTLLTGSIIVSDRSTRQSHSLSPGQQSTLTGTNLTVTEADTEEATAWKNGYFMFQSEEITSIMRKIARWYDVDVTFDGPQPADKFNGTVRRFVNVSQVLRKLQLTNKVHFNIEGRKIMVTR